MKIINNSLTVAILITLTTAAPVTAFAGANQITGETLTSVSLKNNPDAYDSTIRMSIHEGPMQEEIEDLRLIEDLDENGDIDLWISQLTNVKNVQI